MIPRIVGTLAAVVLVGLGTVHCYWAAGADGRPTSRSRSAGVSLCSHQARRGPLLVALLLFAAALVLVGRLGLWGHWLPRWVFVAGTWTLVLVFGGRVVGDLRWFGLFKQVTGTPFAWWDTWVYVPLCALLALAALLVAALEP